MKTLKLFALFFLVAFVVFGFYWKKESDAIKQGVQSQIDALNHQNGAVSLQYDAILSNGFPSEIAVSLSDPRLQLNESNFLSQFIKKIDMIGPLTMRFSLPGDLKSIDYMGDTIVSFPIQREGGEFSYLLKGNWTISDGPHALLKDEARFLTDKNGSPFWERLSVDDLTLGLENIHVSDLQLKTAVLSLKKGQLHLANRKKGQEGRELVFEIKTKGLNLKDLSSYLFKQSKDETFFTDLNRAFAEASYSNLGNIDWEFDFKADAPNFEKWERALKGFPTSLLLEPVPAISLTSKNRYAYEGMVQSQEEYSLSIENTPQGTEVAAIKAHMHTSFTKAYREALIKALRELSQTASSLHPSTQTEKNIQELIVHHADLIENLVPQFDKMGIFDSLFDLHAEVDRKKMKGSVHLRHLDFMTDLYGIRMEGKAVGDFASGKCKIHLIHYRPLVKDLMSYVNRLIAAGNVIFKDVSPLLHPLSSSSEEKIVLFLQEIADQKQKNGDDLTITIAIKDGAVLIGKEPLLQFLSKASPLIDQINQELYSTPK